MNRSFLILALGAALGLFAGWALWGGAAVHEGAAAAVVQPDSSLVLERAGKLPDSAAPHVIPKGAKEVRRVQVVVQPARGVVARLPVDTGEAGRLVASADHPPVVDSCDCPPVEVNLSLVRMPDKTGRVVASSPNGKVLTGIDFPMESLALPPASKLWAAGGYIDGQLRLGAFLERDLGPLRVGGHFAGSQALGPSSGLWLGLRF